MGRTSTSLILPLFISSYFFSAFESRGQLPLPPQDEAKQLQAEQSQKHYATAEQFSEVTDVTYHLSVDLNGIPDPITIQSSSNCNCWLTRDGSWAVVPMTGTIDPATGFPCSGCPGLPPNYRNDDSYTNPSVALPFSFCLKNVSRTRVFINNNGNISFGVAYSTYTPDAFPDITFPEMIAPFFGDVDTRNINSGLVYYQLTATHLAIQWENVGYYNQHVDKKNTFQLIITNGSDPIIEMGNNVSFCYKDMQWTTGDASSGINGFYGYPATVGVNFGDGVNFLQIGRFDRPGTSYLGPQAGDITAPFSGISWLDNQHFEFNWCNSADTVNVPPIPANLTFCDTISLCVGDTSYPSATFLSPESNQITAITYSTTLANVTTISNSAANTPTIITRVIATTADVGYHTITFTANDNGTPAGQTSVSVLVHVFPLPAAAVTPSNVSCFGGNNGSAIVSASNGTGAYTYSWSPGGGSGTTASNLSAGIYTITVRDSAGCRTVQTITITQPPAPTVTSLITFPNCPIFNQTVNTTYTTSSYADVSVCASGASGYVTDNQVCTDPNNADCANHFKKDSLIAPFAIMGATLTAVSVQSVYVSLDTIPGNNSRGCGDDNRLWLRSPGGTLFLLAAQKTSNNSATNLYEPTFTVTGPLGVLPNAAGSYNSTGYLPDQSALSAAPWIGEVPGATWAGNANENYAHAAGQWMVYTNDQVGASGCNPAGNYTKITEFCITFRTYPPPSFAWSTDISSSSGCNTDLANTNTANPTFFVPSSGAYNCTYNLVMTDAAGCISTSSINISCDPLAVSLVRYTGKNTSLGNKLEWVTAMEVNNHYFTIQRSTDGNVFTDLRTVLSQAANGNSSGPLYYSLMDAEVKPGNYYYRLTQTDINGETREAGIISIAVRTDMEIFNVRPNPTTGIVEVNYECESTATTLLKMYDDRGTLLMSKEIECRKGQNTLTLDLSGREDGLYLLSVTTDDDVYKVRLVLRRSK